MDDFSKVFLNVFKLLIREFQKKHTKGTNSFCGISGVNAYNFKVFIILREDGATTESILERHFGEKAGLIHMQLLIIFCEVFSGV